MLSLPLSFLLCFFELPHSTTTHRVSDNGFTDRPFTCFLKTVHLFVDEAKIVYIRCSVQKNVIASGHVLAVSPRTTLLAAFG